MTEKTKRGRPALSKTVEPKRRGERILRSLIIISLLTVAVAGGWYLLQPQSQCGFPTGGEPTSAGVGQGNQGTLAPDFSLIDLDGNAFQLSDSRGSVAVIDFMATWCGPCRMAMPHFGDIWEKYGDAIVLISIDIDPAESEETLRAFAQEFTYATWIWARDTANLGQAYQVTAIPKTVIIDQDGYIRFTHIGVTSASTLISEIDQLLG